jgi:hypothetical protein
MKKLLLLLLTVFSLNLYAQQSNVTIYSEEGLLFKVMLNGVFQNEQAMSQVKLNGLSPISYKVKVVFADTANGTILDQINVRAYAEHYYVIKKKKVTAFEKKTKSLGNSIARDVNAKDETEAAARKEEIERMNERFVLKLHNLVEMAPPAGQPMQQPVQQQQVQQQPVQQRTTVVTQTPPPNTVQQTTTTTTTVNGQPSNANVSMNINLGGVGIGANVTESTTYSSTTTTTTGGAPPMQQQQTIVYVPGYGGPIGCPIPMDPGSFNNAKNSINSKSFEESKLTMAKQIIGSNCLTSAQVREIMMLFSFEGTRLDFAKFAYGRTYDIGNYYMVNDAFTFETSIDELNDYINGYRR